MLLRMRTDTEQPGRKDSPLTRDAGSVNVRVHTGRTALEGRGQESSECPGFLDLGSKGKEEERGGKRPGDGVENKTKKKVAGP